jgi:hypothetical protein
MAARAGEGGDAVRSCSMRLHVSFLSMALVAGCGAGARSPALRISQPAEVTQQVGSTTIALRFSRPTARGRELFGALVPYGAVWHPGADEASTIRVSRAVLFGGQSLAAGTYSIWTIPSPSEWTVILSSAANVFHQPYPEGRDVLRIQVPSRRATHMESLAFYFPFADRTRTALVLHWGETLIEVPITTQASND